MTDKLYNGFNNGRDRSDGVGGREVNHGTQETMTKEQILEKMIEEMPFTLPMACIPYITEAMEIYHNQQLSAERERAGKLVDDMQKLAWYLDSLKQYDIVELIKQTLNEYDTATKES